MNPTHAIAVSLRSYTDIVELHSHEYAQFVLPIRGQLDIEIAGTGGRVAKGAACYVEMGKKHAQSAAGTNSFLVIDWHPLGMNLQAERRLAQKPFFEFGLETQGLIDFMAASLIRGVANRSKTALWAPLLLSSLNISEGGEPGRLERLIAAIENAPFEEWDIERMASLAGISASRLHDIFRQEMGSTPLAWLLKVRLGHVQAWLTNTNWSIAEIAYRSGFSDQSALTKAMRRVVGLTPAVYRRQMQDARTTN